MATTLAVLAADAAAGTEWGARTASVALHLGLIAFAVWSTRQPPIEPTVRHEIATFFYRPERAPVAPPRRPMTGAAPGTWSMPLPPVVVSPAVPMPFPMPAPDWPAASSDPMPGLPGPVAALPPPPPVEGIVDLRAVEEPPVLLSHPVPRYPDILRQAGIEGRVVVEAVIDTAGRAERDGLRIASSSHALFAPEASALVLGSRYRPARFGGRPVRVRILVPVAFALRR